MEENIIGNGQS